MLVRILSGVCRLALGALFVYAGYTKLYPPINRNLFEIAVSTYQLLPVWGVIAVARTLPWLEVALGAVLMIGWKLRYSAAFTALLLGFFTGVQAIAYVRGQEINCGCFGFGEPVGPWTLARDSVMLAAAVFLAVYAWRRQSQPIPEPRPFASDELADRPLR